MTDVGSLLPLMMTSMALMMVVIIGIDTSSPVVNPMIGRTDKVVYLDEINLHEFSLRDDVADKCGLTTCGLFSSTCTQIKWSKNCLDCGHEAKQQNATWWKWDENIFHYGCFYGK